MNCPKKRPASPLSVLLQGQKTGSPFFFRIPIYNNSEDVEVASAAGNLLERLHVVELYTLESRLHARTPPRVNRTWTWNPGGSSIKLLSNRRPRCPFCPAPRPSGARHPRWGRVPSLRAVADKPKQTSNASAYGNDDGGDDLFGQILAGVRRQQLLKGQEEVKKKAKKSSKSKHRTARRETVSATTTMVAVKAHLNLERLR